MPSRRRFTPISPARFKAARLVAGFSFPQTAEALQVTERTVRNWEAGRAKIPYAAFKLLTVLSGFALRDPARSGWTFRADPRN